MCGIAGIISFNQQQELRLQIKKMSDSIRHRGPDDEGFLLASEKEIICAGGGSTPQDVFASSYGYAAKNNINEALGNYSLALAHRRLSILDLSAAGHQPMCSPDKNLWITYNGEIYNYMELREELKEKGHSFITNTDTEVILAAYREWGDSCLSKFNGMWAFVIYDRNKNELFGARDRFGVKPLYYYLDANNFVFASEQKALLKSGLVKTGINPAAVFDFFSKGQLEYEEEGMFKNIFEILPSHAFRFLISSRKFSKWQYYDLHYNNNWNAFDETKYDILGQIKYHLKEAVLMRLRSDVPVGSCLSGGIDSSAIVGLIARENKEAAGKLNVYTASFADKKYDESHWAKKMVDASHAQWHQTFPDEKGLAADIQDLIYSQDIPIWSTSTYAQHRVMASVKESGVKVVLDGQGGDELFAGYSFYNMFYSMELLKQFHFKEFTGEVLHTGKRTFLRDFLKYPAINSLPASLRKKINLKYFGMYDFMNEDFKNTYEYRLARKEYDTTSLNKVLHREFFNGRLKQYLKCEDRCSMWHSVESRTPFADDVKLIEYVFSLPSYFKIRGGVNKYVLREAVKDVIPSEIYSRKDKMGYSTPNNKWVMAIKDEMKDLFNDNSLKEYINTEKLLKNYDSFFDLRHKPDTGREFRFISFALWKKAFGV